MAFKKADKKQTYLRMALLGPAGSGKSFTALRLAHSIAKGGLIAAFDTERRSLSKYAGDPSWDGGNFEFIVDDEMPDFDVRRYIQAIQDAEKAGAVVMIIDSLSHAWAGPGGILAFVDVKKGNSNNGFSAWRDATPLHNKLIDTILSAKMHIIATLRVKMEYVQDKDANGKTSVRKVGLQPVQRDGVEYEFDVVADMESASLTVSKTRCPALQNKRFLEPGADVAGILMGWLDQGGERIVAAPIAHAGEDGVIPPTQAQVEAIMAACATADRAYTDDQAVALMVRLQGIAIKRNLPSLWEDVIARFTSNPDIPGLLAKLEGPVGGK